MSKNSNKNGRAFEYACIRALYKRTSEHRKVSIIKNQSYKKNKESWRKIDKKNQDILEKAAEAPLGKLIELEPKLIEYDESEMTIEFQKDAEGISGDVRDIVIKRKNIKWEIGISVKHNHEALKHSRIAKSLDFGKEWYNIPCSDTYWESVNPIFSWLSEEKENKTLWKDIPHKKDKVYLPLLNAFIEEIKRASQNDPCMITRMVNYLIGKKDYYKIISKDKKEETLIYTFNIQGNLSTELPKVALPDKLEIRMKPKFKTTVEMFLNKDWQINFRIHSPDKEVMPSLKFDITLEHHPVTVKDFICSWEK